MKKIKTINKLLSSLTLLSPLSGIGFNNQYQNTQKVITENNNDALINSFRSNAEPVQMGDIWVTVDDSDPTIITGYSSGNGTLTVASNIKQIKDDAFHEGTPELQGLDLSQAISLTTIGDQAFYSCKNLTGDLVIPSSVTNIGQFAFYTTKITSLDLSNATSLTTIGQGGFNSTNITSLDLSQATSLITIEPTTFEYCTNLTGNITIPSSVTTIDNYAFHGTNITSLDLSQATSLTTIGYQTFHSCTNLTGDLVFPSSIRIIGGSCFGNSNIKNLYFLSENPPTSFGANWQPTVTGKVYVPSEEAKSKYTSAENFGFTEEQIEVIGVSGKTLINIDEKSTDSEQYTTITGFSATKWEIVMTEEGAIQPEWLSIDNQGILSWTDQCAVGTYKFKIKATNDLQVSVESAPITFVVNESIEPEPTPEKSNIPLILGLLIGLGIPVILAIAFIIWYLTKKKKTTVKI